MLIKVASITNNGLKTIGVDVEVNLASRGLPAFDLIGLPNKAVAESKERVRTAIINSGFEFPSRKIIVNLAPADLPKQGAYYDLPIALGILSAALNCNLPQDSLFFGELSLDGSLRHTKGALLLALFAKEKKIKKVYLPSLSANEAAVVRGVEVYPIENLQQLVSSFSGQFQIKPALHRKHTFDLVENVEFDMAEIIGQEQAKRALAIAASGGHNCLMVGSPGAGKTMLAQALAGILPPLTEPESLEVTKIYSLSGLIPAQGSLIKTRPFRAPHHSISPVGLIGGGSLPIPGEISLAHRGVLFLDEFNEFSRAAMEGLRQPLEDGKLTVSRSKQRVTFPSRFILAASANPCPCGYLYHPRKACICTPQQIKKYSQRISGPILDRIDLNLQVPVVEIEKLANNGQQTQMNLSSEIIRKQVMAARSYQLKRFRNENICFNAEMRNHQIKKHCILSAPLKKLLVQAADKFELSARAYFKVIKVARTIADLNQEPEITDQHILEALQYRIRLA